MESKKMISVAEASAILRVSDRQTRRYCNEDKLRSEKQNNTYLIELDSVLELLQKAEVQLVEKPTDGEAADTPATPVRTSGHTDVRADDPDENIAAIIDEGRTYIQAVSGCFEILIEHISSEDRRNQVLQARLVGLLNEFQMSPAAAARKRWFHRLFWFLIFMMIAGFFYFRASLISGFL